MLKRRITLSKQSAPELPSASSARQSLCICSVMSAKHEGLAALGQRAAHVLDQQQRAVVGR